MSAHGNSVPKVYRSVVEDVITNMREAFLDDGVDEQVLMELKQLWESKIQQSKAVDSGNPELEILNQIEGQKHIPGQKPTGVMMAARMKPQLAQVVRQAPVPAAQPVQVFNAATGTLEPLSAPAASAAMALPQGIYQQQIALQPGMIVQSNGQQFIVTANGMLQQVQQPGTGSYTVAAPHVVTTQNQFQQQQQQQQPSVSSQHVVQLDGTHDETNEETAKEEATGLAGAEAGPSHSEVDDVLKCTGARPKTQKRHLLKKCSSKKGVPQLDGKNDSSSDEYDEDDKDDDDDDDDEPNDDENELQGEEEEPLNSADDVSDDDDPADLFDTDNVIVCQYDKINRAKNKWKFTLKDGIMNVNGKDYVFHRLLGDAEW